MGKLIDGQFAQRADRALRGDGEPPDNGGMETRIVKLEAVIPTLATKEDLMRVEGSLRTEMHKEFHAQTWRLIGVLTAMFAGLLGVMAKGFHWL